MNHRNRSLIQEYQGLIDSTEKDIQLVYSTAEKCRRILKDNPDLLDEAYKKNSMNALKELFESKSELKNQLVMISNVLGHEQAVNLEERLGTLLNQRHNMQANDFPELKTLQSIWNQQQTSSALPTTAARSRRGNQSLEGIEVVEETQGDATRLDPLSRAPIKILVRNKCCKHHYCYETIVPYIKTAQIAKCPIAGCTLLSLREDQLEFVS